MKYELKNSQQTLINLLRAKNNAHYILGNNQSSIKYLLKDFKNNNIISHNSNCLISKFKTTKNSPERFLFEKPINQKNQNKNEINFKKTTKFPIKGKMFLNNQKRAEKIMEELLKNRISKNSNKITNKLNENKNNSINQGTIYKNVKQISNNTNINENMNMDINDISHILPNKTKYSQMQGSIAIGPNSYRIPQKRGTNFLDDEEYFINYNKNFSKSNNIMNKKLISSSSNKQKKSKTNGASFNTIIAKKNFYSQKQNIMNNYNKDNINKEILNNNIQNNNYIRQSINKTNSIFSSTMN